MFIFRCSCWFTLRVIHVVILHAHGSSHSHYSHSVPCDPASWIDVTLSTPSTLDSILLATVLTGVPSFPLFTFVIIIVHIHPTVIQPRPFPWGCGHEGVGRTPFLSSLKKRTPASDNVTCLPVILHHCPHVPHCDEPWSCLSIFSPADVFRTPPFPYANHVVVSPASGLERFRLPCHCPASSVMDT